MKPKHCFKACFIVICFVIFHSPHLLAQYAESPKVEWAMSIDIPKKNDFHEEDWALAVIETRDGNYLSAGFSQGVVSQSFNTPDRRLPGWTLTSPKGELLGAGVVSEFPGDTNNSGSSKKGSFLEVVEGDDGYYFVGYKRKDTNGANFFSLVKLNKQTLQVDYAKFLEAPNGTSGETSGFGFGIDLVRNASGQEVGLVLSGYMRWGQFGERRGVILKTDMGGNLVDYWWAPGGAIDIGEEIRNCKVAYSSTGAPESIVFTGFRGIANNSFFNSGSTPHYNADGLMTFFGEVNRPDRDVLVGKINYNDFSSGADYLKLFNSASVENSNPQPDDIFTTHPKEYVNEYGPGTPGRTIDNNDPGCTLPSDPDCCYSEVLDTKFALNSNDFGQKILIAQDGNIIVSAWLNAFIIDGDVSQYRLQNNAPEIEGQPDDDHSHDPVISANCRGFEYIHYYDAEAYVLKFDINTGNLLNAQHAGHLSGGDFNTPIAEEADGSIVLGGTTADINLPDLPDVTAPFANFLIKMDANLDVQWRHHFVGKGIGNCLFGMTNTRDGGYVVCGNTFEPAPNAMSEDVEHYSIIKLAPNCIQETIDFDTDISFPTHTINNSNNQWTTDRKIQSLIVVPYGQILTIDGSATPGGIFIEFAYSAHIQDFTNQNPVGIRVEKGGRLIVKNATLRGVDACGGPQMWDGIGVEGFPLPSTSDKPGLVRLQEGAVIEDAVIGVLLDRMYYDVQTEETASSYTGYNDPANIIGINLSYRQRDIHNNRGGGRIFSDQATFLNNREGVVFHKVNYNNNSRLKNTRFICDKPMHDQYTYVEDGPNRRRLGTRAFAVLEEVQNVQFEGCSFLGSSDLDFDLRGTAIEGYDAKFGVMGTNAQSNDTEFKDLHIGIDVFSVFSAFNNSLNIVNNNFANVYRGMNLRGTVGSNIAGNQFLEIPQEGLLAQGWGIFCSKARGFFINNNLFENTIPNGAIGLIISNSRDDGGLIEENDFIGLRLGNQLEDVNPELSVSCNDYENIQTHAWTVLEDLSNYGSLKNQGVGDGNGEEKANNEFIDGCTGSLPGEFKTHIYSAFDFNYFTKAGNPHRPYIECSSTTFNLNINAFDNSGANCIPFSPPCPKPPCLPEERSIYDGSAKEVADRNRLMRRFLHWNSYEIPDSTGLIEVDSVLQLLDSRTAQADYRLQVAGLTAFARYAEANMKLSQVVGADQETQDFLGYYGVLIQEGLAGNSWNNLPDSSLQLLLNYQNQPTSVAANARSLAYYYKGVYPHLIPLEIPAAPGLRLNKSEEAETTLEVAPNPFIETVRFHWPDQLISSLTITDIHGRVIETFNFDEGQALLDWTPKALPAGTYIYQLTTSSGQQEVGKLLYLR